MSTTTSRTPLDRRRIVDAAIALADRDGLDATSMRRVAESLGVTPMALYKYVDGREQLLDEMVDRLIEAVDEPAGNGPWREVLRTRILATRAALAAHPWAQDAVESRTLASPRVLAYMDSLMAVMFAGGLSADLVHHAMHALSTRMWGFTRDVMPTPRLPEAPDERARAMAAYATAYPAIVRMATTAPHADLGCDDDAEFEFALDLLLDGVERHHRAGWGSPDRG